ncbi:MAG TPA: hypothetical protein DEV64_02960, partial [Rhodospirillaceae bacterium]|nr:hypothetical protein [Rhodospirillaceae bacterium]
MTTYHELSIDKLFRLDGEVALVTGGGDGFGRIASMTYANAGASVAVTDIDKTKADAVVAEIIDGGGHAVALELDVSDRTALKSTIDEAASVFGGLHILVNNAGITRRGPTLDMTDDDWDSVIEINQTAVVLGSKAAVPHMLVHGDGKIINLASIVGLVGNRHFAHIGYQAAKGAIVNITRGLA